MAELKDEFGKLPGAIAGIVRENFDPLLFPELFTKLQILERINQLMTTEEFVINMFIGPHSLDYVEVGREVDPETGVPVPYVQDRGYALIGKRNAFNEKLSSMGIFVSSDQIDEMLLVLTKQQLVKFGLKIQQISSTGVDYYLLQWIEDATTRTGSKKKQYKPQ